MEAENGTSWNAGGHSFVVGATQYTERGNAPAPVQARPSFPLRVPSPAGFAPKMPVCSGFVPKNATWLHPAEERRSKARLEEDKKRSGANARASVRPSHRPDQLPDRRADLSPVSRAAIRALLLQGILSLLLVLCFASQLNVKPPAAAGMEICWAADYSGQAVLPAVAGNGGPTRTEQAPPVPFVADSIKSRLNFTN